MQVRSKWLLTLHATWCYRIHKIISVTWYYITLKWPHYHAPPISKVRENKRNLKWSMMEYVSGGYVYIMLWVVNLPGRLQISLRCESMGIGDFMTLCSNKKGSNCSLCWVAWVYKCMFVANPLSLIYEQAQINLTFRRKKNVLKS